MLKKLLIAGAVLGGITLLALSAPFASADYYDCSGQFHYGDPGPSTCHYFIRPNERTRVPNDRNVLEPNEREPREPSVQPREPEINVLEPQPRDPYRPDVDQDRDVNVLVPQRREPSRTPSTTDRDEPRYEIRNTRRYCVRDLCYIVYDYCDDLGHCTEKVKTYDNPNYHEDIHEDIDHGHGHTDKYSRTWNYWINNYVYNYFYGNRNRDNCYPDRGRCIYRGFHFGGFHNGYWYY